MRTRPLSEYELTLSLVNQLVKAMTEFDLNTGFSSCGCWNKHTDNVLCARSMWHYLSDFKCPAGLAQHLHVGKLRDGDSLWVVVWSDYSSQPTKFLRKLTSDGQVVSDTMFPREGGYEARAKLVRGTGS